MLKSNIANQPCFIGGRFQAGAYAVSKFSNFTAAVPAAVQNYLTPLLNLPPSYREP